MARTVKTKITSPNNFTLSKTYTITYDDYSTESFAEGAEPDIDWKEVISNGKRVGWVDASGAIQPLVSSSWTTYKASPLPVWNHGSGVTAGYTRIFDGYNISVSYTSVCSKCKKAVAIGNIKTSYNWCSQSKLDRHICNKCYTRAMDNFFGLANNIDAEITLFDKKKE